MEFENEESRLLFLMYALPCSETLVKRGVISQSYRRRLMKAIFLNKKIPENSEKIFKVANLMCEKIARKLGKKSIDENIVRKYFLFEHDKIVDKRYKIFRDFDPLACRLYSGKVINIKNRKATVQTIVRRKKYGMYPFQNLKTGDYVVVHRNIIIEKINESLAKKLWKLKENYFKSNKA
jgi:hydrogenase maturation factor